MTTDQARAAGIKPAHGSDDDETPTGLELAPVDLLVRVACEVDQNGDVIVQRSIFIAAGDPIPAHLAGFPRVDRATGSPIE